MSKHTIKNTCFTLLLLAASPIWTGCGDDDDADASKTTEAGRAARAGRGGSSEAGAAAGKAAAGSGGSSAAAGKGGSGSCEGPKGCYSCEPQESTHYLNHCTDSECEPFDNDTRLPLLKDGELPPLP